MALGKKNTIENNKKIKSSKKQSRKKQSKKKQTKKKQTLKKFYEIVKNV